MTGHTEADLAKLAARVVEGMPDAEYFAAPGFSSTAARIALSAVMGVDPRLEFDDPAAWADAIHDLAFPTSVERLTGKQMSKFGGAVVTAVDVRAENEACQAFGGRVWVDGERVV